jgi:hypothetical protein
MKNRDLKRARDFLTTLGCISNRKQANKLLQSAPRYVIDAISEVLYNMLMNNNVCLTPKRKSILCQHRTFVSRNSDKRNPLKWRTNQILNYKQKGGFLGALLPLITAVLGQLL